jgi:hypothetical protein
MRIALVIAVALAAACSGGGTECSMTGEDDCTGGLVCARSSECLPPEEIWKVSISWTVRGQVANATSCAPAPSLYLLFYSGTPGDEFGYQPVPCVAGLFTMDKLPRRFTGVEIGVDGGFNAEKSINAQGLVAFDLMP